MGQSLLYTFTGNPFVDAGIWAICEWSGRKKPEEIEIKDLKGITSDVVPLYITAEWVKSLYSVFPNNAVTNPSVKNKGKKLAESLDQLINQVESLERTENLGNCISCGRYDIEEIRTKTEIPLIGSGTLINFFPYGQQGADHCPACTLAVQFSPLTFYACGKNTLMMMFSDTRELSKKQMVAL